MVRRTDHRDAPSARSTRMSRVRSITDMESEEVLTAPR
jgi:hypothetical protein